MSPSPIPIGAGNGAGPGPLPVTPAQGAAPPAQGQPARSAQAEFVVCDQTIERLVGELKRFRRVATRYDKLAAHYLAFVQLAATRMWL